MRTIVKEEIIYSLDDVKNNPELLKKVLEKHYHINVEYHDWWDGIYEKHKEETKFNVDRRYFSGFCSQGDGAMFEYSGFDSELKDQLIEKKVDDKINAFTASIREQISKFLTDNGEYTGDYLYTVDKWDTNIPLTYNHVHLRKVQEGLVAGISKHVKEKMITKETKELLEKVNLLS